MKRPFVQDIQQGVQGCYLCLHILASDRLTSIPQIPISSLDLSSTLDVLICYAAFWCSTLMYRMLMFQLIVVDFVVPPSSVAC